MIFVHAPLRTRSKCKSAHHGLLMLRESQTPDWARCSLMSIWSNPKRDTLNKVLTQKLTSQVSGLWYVREGHRGKCKPKPELLVSAFGLLCSNTESELSYHKGSQGGQRVYGSESFDLQRVSWAAKCGRCCMPHFGRNHNLGCTAN